MSTLTLADILARLSGVRRSGNGWSARCPAHDDRRNSLSVAESADGKILLLCHAGCATVDIIKLLGLDWSALFKHSSNGRPGSAGAGALHRAAPARPNGQSAPTDPLGWLSDYCAVPRDFLTTLPLDADGQSIIFNFAPGLAHKVRQAGGKDFRWEPPGAPTPPLWPIPDALSEVIWLTEGETDCIIARYCGLAAYGMSKGAGGTLTTEQARALQARGVRIARICFDADNAGREGARKLTEVLRQAGVEPIVLDLGGGVVDPLRGEKDLRDAWLRLQDRAVMLGALERAALEAAKPAINGQPPHLQPIGTLVGGEVCAADLKARPRQEIDYLSFLGRAGYIPRGWSVLVAAYPKAGKTELMARLCGSWATQGESILYVTEESESIWQLRLSALPGDWGRLRLLFGLGMGPDAILERIRTGRETIVVVDTVRNLLGLEDETDNSEVARVLGPYVVAAREANKTLLLLHHDRKGGGEHGEGISGGHAFLGIVDVALEILREPNLGDRKRRVRGWGRLMPIEEIVYALADDGTMSVLGSPKAVELGAVKERVLEGLNGAWAKTREIWEQLSEPRPSLEQVRLALNALFAEGAAERDPAADKPGATYRYRLAQPHLQPTPYMVGGEVVDNKPHLQPIGTEVSPVMPGEREEFEL